MIDRYFLAKPTCRNLRCEIKCVSWHSLYRPHEFFQDWLLGENGLYKLIGVLEGRRLAMGVVIVLKEEASNKVSGALLAVIENQKVV